MKTALFDYQLPKCFIANEPVSKRDQSRLLIYDTSVDRVYHKKFFEIGKFLNSTDVLVLNSSKVIPARVRFKIAGAQKEIFILKNLGHGGYEVLVKPGKFFRPGRIIEISHGRKVEILRVNGDGTRIIRVNFELESMGIIPLPPYIDNEDIDFESYQTVYAKEPGSVAAPTAGLHFTKSLIKKIEARGIRFEKVLLHVGLGTFLPVKSETLDGHLMHREFFDVSKSTLQNLQAVRASGGRVIAVGTTTVRVLESAAKFNFKNLKGETNIFIYPGAHDWKFVDGLVTNFHLPKSTLMMLVASFLENKGVKRPIKKLLDLYELAKQEKYRFYSFGDAMFIY